MPANPTGKFAAHASRYCAAGRGESSARRGFLRRQSGKIRTEVHHGCSRTRGGLRGLARNAPSGSPGWHSASSIDHCPQPRISTKDGILTLQWKNLAQHVNRVAWRVVLNAPPTRASATSFEGFFHADPIWVLLWHTAFQLLVLDDRKIDKRNLQRVGAPKEDAFPLLQVCSRCLFEVAKAKPIGVNCLTARRSQRSGSIQARHSRPGADLSRPRRSPCVRAVLEPTLHGDQIDPHFPMHVCSELEQAEIVALGSNRCSIAGSFAAARCAVSPYTNGVHEGRCRLSTQRASALARGITADTGRPEITPRPSSLASRLNHYRAVFKRRSTFDLGKR